MDEPHETLQVAITSSSNRIIYQFQLDQSLFKHVGSNLYKEADNPFFFQHHLLVRIQFMQDNISITLGGLSILFYVPAHVVVVPGQSTFQSGQYIVSMGH